MPSRIAASATAWASIASDFPLVLVAFRDSPVNAGGTRITRSPAPNNARSRLEVTCRQSSTAQTRSWSALAANRNAASTRPRR